MRAAVIGIGSNSVRMLVADIQGGGLRQVHRDREGTRLFSGLGQDGNLSTESMQKTLEAVSVMHQKAKTLSIDQIHLFATSAVRDAGNQEQFSSMILKQTGLVLEVCTGELEAALSFFGATSGSRSGVIDIGGGSTEYVVGRGAKIDCGVSLQMGAVRLFRLYPMHSSKDVPTVLETANEILVKGIAPVIQAGLPDTWVGVGGTFTALAAIIKGVAWMDKAQLSGCGITLKQAEDWLIRLADMPLEDRLKLHGLQPQRADIMAHGTAILVTSMRVLNIASITVSEFGNLDGYLKHKYLL